MQTYDKNALMSEFSSGAIRGSDTSLETLKRVGHASMLAISAIKLELAAAALNPEELNGADRDRLQSIGKLCTDLAKMHADLAGDIGLMVAQDGVVISETLEDAMLINQGEQVITIEDTTPAESEEDTAEPLLDGASPAETSASIETSPAENVSLEPDAPGCNSREFLDPPVEKLVSLKDIPSVDIPIDAKRIPLTIIDDNTIEFYERTFVTRGKRLAGLNVLLERRNHQLRAREIYEFALGCIPSKDDSAVIRELITELNSNMGRKIIEVTGEAAGTRYQLLPNVVITDLRQKQDAEEEPDTVKKNEF